MDLSYLFQKYSEKQKRIDEQRQREAEIYLVR